MLNFNEIKISNGIEDELYITSEVNALNRNLYTGTKDFSGTWNNKSLWTYNDTYLGFTVAFRNAEYNGISQNVDAIAGQIYTFSGYVKKSGGSTSFYGNNVGTITNQGVVGTLNDTWEYFYKTFTVLTSGILRPRIEQNIAGYTVSVCGLKLEQGSNATPWEYAPEDDPLSYFHTIPTTWDSNTIFDAKFNGSLNAGNVDFVLSQLDTILIKRRPINSNTWVTVCRIPVDNSSDLNFTKIDRWCGYGRYQYAIVPSLNNTEGQYTTIDVDSKFNGFFLCNKDYTFKFLAEAQYGAMEQRKNIGVFEPIGRTYPITVKNAKTNYKKFTFTAKLLSSSFYNTRQISVADDKALRESMMEVLSSGKPMILKDYMGNSYMVTLSASEVYDFLSYSGNSQVNVSLPFVEIGNINDQATLDKNGFVSTT